MLKYAMQLGLPFPKPARRKKPGRKKKDGNHDSPHRPRVRFEKRTPVHVILRVRPEVGRLRKAKVYAAIAHALRVAKEKWVRVVHASIQSNHLHFVVEAENHRDLAKGMQSLGISAAKAINRAMGRTGKVFAYRYFARVLTSPTQVRNAVVYVLNNWRHHREDRNSGHMLDPFSTAVLFHGWVEGAFAVPDGYEALPVHAPRTWLLSVGWQRAKKPISIREVPGTES